MDEITIRRATAEDFPAIAEVDSASFGEEITPAYLEHALTLIDPARFFVAVDGQRIVGVTGDYPFTMSIPGGSLEVPGVTWVSVDVTYRRRGVLSSLMQEQLDDYRRTGYGCAILTASESSIYGRFGYGAASRVRKAEIARRRVALNEAGNPRAVERCNVDEARKRIPEIHERWCAQTSGALTRSEAWWNYIFADKEFMRGGMSPQFYLAHDGGYVIYRIKTDWHDGDPRHLCWITDYVIVTPEAHRDLWQVLLGLDLVGPIESYRIPADDALPYVITDPRQVRTTHVGDGVWVRPLDIAQMFAARSFAVEVDLVVAMDDGDATQKVRVTGGPDGATAIATDESADITFTAPAFGSAYLGGVRLAPLAAAGVVKADDPRVLTRFDRALLTDREPAHGTAF